MLISHKYKFIFVHIYKVAGTSIGEAFKDIAYNPNHKFVDKVLRKTGLNSLPFYRYRNFTTHMSAKEIKSILPKKIFDNYFKFAFIRNPWDWQVSLYYYMLERSTHFQHNLIKSFSGFDEYINWRIIPENTKLQKDFITDFNGELIVDYVGKFESLKENFQELCQLLGIQATLPHINITNHQDYKSYYNAKTRKMIEKHFADDIAYFGYKFDGIKSDKEV